MGGVIGDVGGVLADDTPVIVGMTGTSGVKHQHVNAVAVQVVGRGILDVVNVGAGTGVGVGRRQVRCGQLEPQHSVLAAECINAIAVKLTDDDVDDAGLTGDACAIALQELASGGQAHVPMKLHSHCDLAMEFGIGRLGQVFGEYRIKLVCPQQRAGPGDFLVGHESLQQPGPGSVDPDHPGTFGQIGLQVKATGGQRFLLGRGGDVVELDEGVETTCLGPFGFCGQQERRGGFVQAGYGLNGACLEPDRRQFGCWRTR